MAIPKRVNIIITLEFNLILLYTGAIQTCTVGVKQPSLLEVDYTYQTITIPCDFSAINCPETQPQVLWFRQNVHHQLENLCPDQCLDQRGKFTMTLSQIPNQTSLTLNKVTLNDSAIYFCGIAFSASTEPRSKQTGPGTMLVVRGSKLLSHEVENFLIAALCLLSMYTAVLSAVFIVISKSKLKETKKIETDAPPPKKRSARHIFQEIAQELYQKRYVETKLGITLLRRRRNSKIQLEIRISDVSI
ncbi:immunoglobulin superfamily member 6 isoform X2 [Dromiciops gliroides]|uniref:immunoglobulin superfamily member 6 isoform X2 n=1 Tax=Dromiciops gliroides TaxID=33562 RepID=UPI001CC6373B|nr:immunoglobulin superfamily member 6 isoform X2 [Dromiciops gliroides]